MGASFSRNWLFALRNTLAIFWASGLVRKMVLNGSSSFSCSSLGTASGCGRVERVGREREEAIYAFDVIVEEVV